ncbi:LCP family protein [Streptomyces axinellae]|uniref:Polydiglycosylphosphate transferase PdtA n=1 Tax=Streptomyces axinellae TaxID=552788 RepID=A0ABP6C1X6_9ACTN
MSDGYGYDPYGRQPQPEIVGYDEYGRPVYRQDPQQPGGPPQDGSQQSEQGYASQAPYGTHGSYAAPGAYDTSGAQPGSYAASGAYDPYGQAAAPPAGAGTAASGRQGYYDYDPYDPYGQRIDGAGGQAATGQAARGQQAATGQQPRAGQQTQAAARTAQQGWFPQQSPPPQQEQYGQPQTGPVPGARQEPDAGGAHEPPPASPSGPTAGPSSGHTDGAGQDGQEAGYRTEQFAFVEEPTDDSEDVIDWLKFSESRTERREEAKRKGRNRVVALVVVAVLVVTGGLGYLWYAGMLPGLDGAGKKGAAAAGQQRDVIVVHLREQGGASSTALLVDNAGAGQGSTVLLPNSLAVSAEDGTTTTLGKSVEDEGASPTRDALNTLLGSDIKGTWRLDTPYLENLVELVGGIALDTDTSVPGAKKGEKPQVERGSAVDLDGRAAVAYATYRAPGELQTKQLARFGQVMRAALKKLSSDSGAATKTVESLGQIPDPSLSEKQLGASLAKLASRARAGDYRTRLLPVQANGTLSRQAGDEVVKKILGGTVKNSDPQAALRVSLKNASGKRGVTNAASAALVNGGYAVVKSGSGAARAQSVVGYAKPEHKAEAEEVAKTLDLPASAVRETGSASTADVAVLLGADYKG